MSRYHCCLKSLYHFTPATMSSDSEVSHFPDPDHGIMFRHSHFVRFPELLRATWVSRWDNLGIAEVLPWWLQNFCPKGWKWNPFTGQRDFPLSIFYMAGRVASSLALLPQIQLHRNDYPQSIGNNTQNFVVTGYRNRKWRYWDSSQRFLTAMPVSALTCPSALWWVWGGRGWTECCVIHTWSPLTSPSSRLVLPYPFIDE